MSRVEAAGSTYPTGRADVLRQAEHGDLAIIACDRPRKFAYSVAQRAAGKKDAHLTHTFTLTPSGTGTSVERVTDGDGNPLLGIIFYPAIKADGNVQLKGLKAKAEGRAW